MSLRRALLTALPKKLLSRLTGGLTSIPLPTPLRAPLYRAFAKRYGVRLEECGAALADYPSFRAFFTRSLKEGARRVEGGPMDLCSPVDGKIVSAGRIQEGRIPQVKGWSYEVTELLRGLPQAAQFARGSQATIYLAPGDYHRIHAPSSGSITHFSHVPGTLFPVNPPALRAIPGLFVRNERISLLIQDSPLGELALVAVGALNVGSIHFSCLPQVRTNRGGKGSHGPLPKGPFPIQKGQDLGCFSFGSTVLLLSKDPELEWLDLGKNSRTLQGMLLARIKSVATKGTKDDTSGPE
ncbi:MAG TPA: phosphatidylserine decarboxylase [Planctomycetes bacterium]|nr:phosphatidylserine decarboxylase [Planctomycetota bacterium]